MELHKKREGHTGLKLHEDKLIMTEFSYLRKSFLKVQKENIRRLPYT